MCLPTDMKKTEHNKIFRLTVTGIMGALALALSFTEKMLLSAFPLPMGIKPGFSNIIVMFACTALGPFTAFGIVLLKAGFAALLSGISSGLISLSGGVLSVTTVIILGKLKKSKISYVGISVLSSVMHNVGQTAAASAIAGSSLFLSYFPVLLVSGTVFGIVTGITLNILGPYLVRLRISDSKKTDKNEENGGKNYG